MNELYIYHIHNEIKLLSKQSKRQYDTNNMVCVRGHMCMLHVSFYILVISDKSKELIWGFRKYTLILYIHDINTMRNNYN